MKKSEIFVLIIVSFIFGFFVSQGITLYQKTSIGKSFDGEGIKVKVKVFTNQNVSPEIKELSEMVTEQYLYLLSGAMITEKKECLHIISEALAEATVKLMRIIKQESEIIQFPKPSTKKTTI